jgi:cell division protease FtsH
MDNKVDPNQKNQEKKSPIGGNVVWYLLAMGVFVLFLVSILSGNRGPRLEYSYLVELINNSAHNRDGQEAIIKVVEKDDKKRTFYYFTLHDVKIGNHLVKGRINRILLEDDFSDEMKKKLASLKPADVSMIVLQPPDKEALDAEALAAEGKFLAHTVSFETNRNPSHDTQGRLAEILGATDIRWGYDEGPSFWSSSIFSMLILTALFVFVFFFLMRRLGGAGSAMAFGRSRGKLYAQEDIGVTFDEVAGVDEAVDELREVVEFLSTPEKYQNLGGRIPRGVLLVGPPGTGKTLLAKAVAGEAGVPFFSLSGSDFVEMFVGVGAARVRDMFSQATAKSPCIIFIDELDALGKTRGSGMVGGHDEREQTLNALLVEMDGFDSNSGVIVMGATNRPETLDPALLRPGRFDRQVLVDRPDVRGREEILKVHIEKVKLDDTISLREIAGITSGFVGADLANLVNEAALLAARKGKKAVSMDEFNDGVERVTAGLEKKQRIIHQDEKNRVAYHESGHALVAYSLPNTDPVHKVSIIPRGIAALGYTLQRPEDDRYLMTKAELESRIQVLLAGTITEEIIFDDISTGAQNDLERASEIARSMVMDFGMSRLGRVTYRDSPKNVFLAASADGGHHQHSEQTAREIDEEVKRIIDSGIEKVREILQERKAALIALSERLLETEVIDGDELVKVIEANSPTPMIVPGTSAEPRRTLEDDVDDAPGTQRAEGS